MPAHWRRIHDHRSHAGLRRFRAIVDRGVRSRSSRCLSCSCSRRTFCTTSFGRSIYAVVERGKRLSFRHQGEGPVRGVCDLGDHGLARRNLITSRMMAASARTLTGLKSTRVAAVTVGGVVFLAAKARFLAFSLGPSSSPSSTAGSGPSARRPRSRTRSREPSLSSPLRSSILGRACGSRRQRHEDGREA